MIDAILPECVAAVESFDDRPEAYLYPEEVEAMRNATEKRLREYTTGRHCAREALAALGLPAVSIPAGAQREPLWPVGVRGSITHCAGYRAAALAHSSDLAAVGIDGEPHWPLPEGVLALVATPAEVARLARLGRRNSRVCWDRLAFSAKESLFKAWFALTKKPLEFHDLVLHFVPEDQVFIANSERFEELDGLTGRWLIEDGLVLTAVAVSR